ncbi:hypothetical protein [Roseivirga sp. E12]|uniref:hypothetical protein n=1 Tax=Roseivirga sp. E12 TaxID=2819237 RepID=UPI001ABC4B05|nr:hypothetical protein [Roseivirga sp. E12]MBO3697565.1 hypothetical protein [Roseivirga sp. E12]
MARSVLFVILTLLAFNLHAQEYFEVERDSQLVRPRFAIKIVPTQLAWRFPAYTAALEHRIGENFSVEYKYGLVKGWDVFEDDAIYFADKSGFKSAITLKMYASETRNLSGMSSWFYGDGQNSSILPFIGFELLFNEINFDRTRIFRIDCNNGCEYFEKATYGVSRQEIGIRWNLGFIAKLIGSLNIEMSGAVGFVNQDYTPDSRRPKNFDRMYGRNYDEEFNGIVPSLNLSMKLMYSLK